MGPFLVAWGKIMICMPQLAQPLALSKQERALREGQASEVGSPCGVQAVSLICMKPLQSHKNVCISNNLRGDGRSVCDLQFNIAGVAHC